MKWLSREYLVEEAKAPRHAKEALCSVSLMALGVVFELAGKYVPEMREEIAAWEDGRRVSVGIFPSGPSITIQKQGQNIRYLGTGVKGPDLSILFKNLDSAILIFTGQLGAAQAVAENRVIVHGDNAKAMQMTRAMAIAQTYLFPGFILNKTFKRPPKLTAKQLAVKAMIMGLLTPKLAAAAKR